MTTPRLTIPEALKTRAEALMARQRGRPAISALDVPAGYVLAVVLNLGVDASGDGIGFFGAAVGIVDSQYMDVLKDGGYDLRFGRGIPYWYQELLRFDHKSGTTVTDDTVQEELAEALNAPFVEGQSDSGIPYKPAENVLYLVFLQPNVTYTAKAPDPITGVINQYSSAATSPGPFRITGWNAFFFLNNDRSKTVYYLVIPFPGGTNSSANGLGDYDALTEAASHEIAESLTKLEIADKISTHVRMSNGVAVQLVGEKSDFTKPLPIPGATLLPS